MCQGPTSVSAFQRFPRSAFFRDKYKRAYLGICGCRNDGKTFTQKASFRGLGRKGAWIEGVARMIQPGEIIGLQYEATGPVFA
jgi:hypothetical protein